MEIEVVVGGRSQATAEKQGISHYCHQQSDPDHNDLKICVQTPAILSLQVSGNPKDMINKLFYMMNKYS